MAVEEGMRERNEGSCDEEFYDCNYNRVEPRVIVPNLRTGLNRSLDLADPLPLFMKNVKMRDALAMPSQKTLELNCYTTGNSPVNRRKPGRFASCRNSPVDRSSCDVSKVRGLAHSHVHGRVSSNI